MRLLVDGALARSGLTAATTKARTARTTIRERATGRFGVFMPGDDMPPPASPPETPSAGSGQVAGVLSRKAMNLKLDHYPSAGHGPRLSYRSPRRWSETDRVLLAAALAVPLLRPSGCRRKEERSPLLLEREGQPERRTLELLVDELDHRALDAYDPPAPLPTRREVQERFEHVGRGAESARRLLVAPAKKADQRFRRAHGLGDWRDQRRRGEGTFTALVERERAKDRSGSTGEHAARRFARHDEDRSALAGADEKGLARRREPRRSRPALPLPGQNEEAGGLSAGTAGLFDHDGLRRVGRAATRGEEPGAERMPGRPCLLRELLPDIVVPRDLRVASGGTLEDAVEHVPRCARAGSGRRRTEVDREDPGRRARSVPADRARRHRAAEERRDLACRRRRVESPQVLALEEWLERVLERARGPAVPCGRLRRELAGRRRAGSGLGRRDAARAERQKDHADAQARNETGQQDDGWLGRSVHPWTSVAFGV